jgi:hypothetical protein
MLKVFYRFGFADIMAYVPAEKTLTKAALNK